MLSMPASFPSLSLAITFLRRYALADPTHLISRLTSRNLHLLALRISTYLRLRPDVVLRHWASAKIAQSKQRAGSDDMEEDEEICRVIVEKFEGALGAGGGVGGEAGGGISYSEVARKAWVAGRTRLATKVILFGMRNARTQSHFASQLLDYEPNAGDQVPLLLSMKEDRLALTKAIDSGDTDLGMSSLLFFFAAQRI